MEDNLITIIKLQNGGLKDDKNEYISAQNIILKILDGNTVLGIH